MGNIVEKAALPIGVFDSGVGGISVLRELAFLMPNENYIFYGDSKNAPYGTKSLEDVQRLTCADAEHLMEKGIKALVVACNTATSAAIHILREKYKDMPVIGIEPALKPAVLFQENPRVLVMATPMTLREKKFQKLMLRFQEKAEILPLPCPGLVEFVERGELESDALKRFLQELFSDYQRTRIDAVVLGCTHYPFVRSMIEQVLGDGVTVFDGGAGTARETRRKLMAAGILNPSSQKGTVIFENSLQEEKIQKLCHTLFLYGKEKFIKDF